MFCIVFGPLVLKDIPKLLALHQAKLNAGKHRKGPLRTIDVVAIAVLPGIKVLLILIEKVLDPCVELQILPYAFQGKPVGETDIRFRKGA